MHDAKAEARSYDPGMADLDDMVSSVASSLQARTGRTLDEWVRTVADGGIDPLDQLAVRRWLRDEHGVPQNSQWAIADATARAAGWSRPSVDEYIDTQYSGAKAALRPIFDHIHAIATALGDDVSVQGRSTYTPYVRGRQFAAVAPATRRRVDLGLRYVDPPASGRLVPTRAPGQSTHKIILERTAEVDAEVASLLRLAYEQNG